jgi:hypothetical protein
MRLEAVYIWGAPGAALVVKLSWKEDGEKAAVESSGSMK